MAEDGVTLIRRHGEGSLTEVRPLVAHAQRPRVQAFHNIPAHC